MKDTRHNLKHLQKSIILDVNCRYNCLRTALGMLKQKQEVATISIDIIEAPDHPSYHTLDNLHK